MSESELWEMVSELLESAGHDAAFLKGARCTKPARLLNAFREARDLRHKFQKTAQAAAELVVVAAWLVKKEDNLEMRCKLHEIQQVFQNHGLFDALEEQVKRRPLNYDALRRKVHEDGVLAALVARFSKDDVRAIVECDGYGLAESGPVPRNTTRLLARGNECRTHAAALFCKLAALADGRSYLQSALVKCDEIAPLPTDQSLWPGVDFVSMMLNEIHHGAFQCEALVAYSALTLQRACVDTVFARRLVHVGGLTVLVDALEILALREDQRSRLVALFLSGTLANCSCLFDDAIKAAGQLPLGWVAGGSPVFYYSYATGQSVWVAPRQRSLVDELVALTMKIAKITTRDAVLSAVLRNVLACCNAVDCDAKVLAAQLDKERRRDDGLISEFEHVVQGRGPLTTSSTDSTTDTSVIDEFYNVPQGDETALSTFF